MKNTILDMVENLKQTLAWEEKNCEETKKWLIEQATRHTAEELAHGYLDSNLRDIGRSVEKIKSLHEQIEVLELAIKKSEM